MSEDYSHCTGCICLACGNFEPEGPPCCIGQDELLCPDDCGGEQKCDEYVEVGA